MKKHHNTLRILALAVTLSITTPVIAEDTHQTRLLQSAQQGNADAQYYLAEMYRLGYDATQSYSKALYWYSKAANQGMYKHKTILALCIT